MKKQNKSRHIPKTVSDAVKSRHHFQCAWCGVHLTERHHIEEFSQGGTHATDNLILLCPNCHTLVHKGEISEAELYDRKSTHAKGDRISGGFQTSIAEMKLLIGTNYFILNDSHEVAIVRSQNNPIMSIVKEGEKILLSLRLFDEEGNLIFWMHKNMFWSLSETSVMVSKSQLKIVDDANRYSISISEVDDYLELQLKNYIDGYVFKFDKKSMSYRTPIGGWNTMSNSTINVSGLKSIFEI